MARFYANFRGTIFEIKGGRTANISSWSVACEHGSFKSICVDCLPLIQEMSEETRGELHELKRRMAT